MRKTVVMPDAVAVTAKRADHRTHPVDSKDDIAQPVIPRAQPKSALVAGTLKKLPNSSDGKSSPGNVVGIPERAIPTPPCSPQLALKGEMGTPPMDRISSHIVPATPPLSPTVSPSVSILNTKGWSVSTMDSWGNRKDAENVRTFLSARPPRDSLYGGVVGTWDVVDTQASQRRSEAPTFYSHPKRQRPSKHDLEYDAGRVKKIRKAKPWYVGKLS